MFTPKEIDLSKINGGKRYKDGDIPNAETFNAPIEASAFVQSLVKNPIDTSLIEADVPPKISIQPLPDGTPQFKVEGLKGKEGDTGSVKLYRYNTRIELSPSSGFSLALITFDFTASKDLFEGEYKSGITIEQLHEILREYIGYGKSLISNCFVSQAKNGFGVVNCFVGQSVTINFVTSDGQFNSISLKNSDIYYLSITKVEV
jgi:hypothetical protein